MMKVSGAWLTPRFAILAAVSCGFPQLPAVDGGDEGEPPPVSLEVLAGDIGGPGNLDGLRSAARFNNPSKAAIDNAGNVFVTDEFNHTIRKISAAGAVTTLAGSPGRIGGVDGTGAAAGFNSPRGIVLDSNGNLYVADSGSCAIRKITPDGTVTTFAGTLDMCSGANGTGPAARFNHPSGLAIDSNGTLYVADTDNHTIRKITAAGVVTTLAGSAGMRGGDEGTGAAARFNEPLGLTVDAGGTVYVCDSGNNTIRRVTAAGVVTTFAGLSGEPGGIDGVGTAAMFDHPADVDVVHGTFQALFVADTSSALIRKVTLSGASVTTLAGAVRQFGSLDGTGPAARFGNPTGIVADTTGNLHVVDRANHAIRRISTSGVVTTLAGAAEARGGADGTGAAATFARPSGLAADDAGNIYVADNENSTIRKVTAEGVVTTVAGSAGVRDVLDGPGPTARLSDPDGVAIDSAGNLYVADRGNHTIRKITAAGDVTTLAGTGRMPGSVDGIGPAARFRSPAGVAVDSAGNVYVGDTGNDTVRKITPDGVVTTIAGAAGMPGSADGTGGAARFDGPSSVVLDRAGNLYVADRQNWTIRKVTPDAVVTTLAGTAGMSGSADGTGAAARFGQIHGIAIDSAGNVYVVDRSNKNIRKITPDGVTTTVVGTAGAEGILLGTAPRLGFPQGLTIVDDSLVITDTGAILVLRHGAR
jgi:sugar lactone lactonase YvrE